MLSAVPHSSSNGSSGSAMFNHGNEVVTSASELSKLLAEERSRNRLLQQQLEAERARAEQLEQILARNGGTNPIRRHSGSSTSSDSPADMQRSHSPAQLDDNPKSHREARLISKLDKTQTALDDMKRKVEIMQRAQESMAIRVEVEEDMLSNQLLRKLRVVQRDKECLQLELSRSSRSSSLDGHSVDSACSNSVAGSQASEVHSLRDLETRSEISGISNLACCSVMSDELPQSSRKRELPPPPTVVGEK